MKLFRLATLVLFAWTGSTVRAQTPAPAAADPIAEALREKEAEIRAAALELAASLARSDSTLADGNVARLLQDLNIQFKTFERDDGGDPALGFEYDVDKALMHSGSSGAWALEFVARGNVAFDQDVNPDDFLSTSLRARWFGAHAFGPKAPPAAPADLLAFDPPKFAKVAAAMAQNPSAAAVRKDPDFIDITNRFYQGYLYRLPPELIYDFDLHASLESNQDFSSRQEVFGASFGGRLVSWNPDASLSKLNVFDFPGAALRWLAGQDGGKGFAPAGDAFPTLVAGLDLVEASDDDVRSALTSDDSFFRGRIEAGLKTRLYSTDATDYYLSAGWRFYQELDAPAAVKNAELDQSSHVQVRLDLPKGWAVTYSAGKLPLDGQDDSTFALGFNVQF